MIERLKEKMGTRLTTQQYGTILSCVAAFSYSTVVTIERASRWMDLDRALAEDVLNNLTAIGTLEKYHAVRCPKCNLLLEKVEYMSDYEDETYCYGCSNDINVDASDIDVCYSLPSGN